MFWYFFGMTSGRNLKWNLLIFNFPGVNISFHSSVWAPCFVTFWWQIYIFFLIRFWKISPFLRACSNIDSVRLCSFGIIQWKTTSGVFCISVHYYFFFLASYIFFFTPFFLSWNFLLEIYFKLLLILL